jgi:hypothetical protein
MTRPPRPTSRPRCPRRARDGGVLDLRPRFGSRRGLFAPSSSWAGSCGSSSSRPVHWTETLTSADAATRWARAAGYGPPATSPAASACRPDRRLEKAMINGTSSCVGHHRLYRAVLRVTTRAALGRGHLQAATRRPLRPLDLSMRTPFRGRAEHEAGHRPDDPPGGGDPYTSTGASTGTSSRTSSTGRPRATPRTST